MRRVIIAAVIVIGPSAGVSAQELSPPPEHAGIGLAGGAGVPGVVASIRVSLPATRTIAVDVDAGRGYGFGNPYTVVGGQMRWHWRGRRTAGGSVFGVFGAVVLSATQRSAIRFPGHTVVQMERRTAIAPQVGIGWDWQARHGTRLGLELTAGGSMTAGPRALAKVFAVWGRPLR